MFGRVNRPFTFPFFLSPVWLYEMYFQAKRQGCDLVLVRDLPMALGAIAVAKLLGMRTVLDMAECYPEILKAVWKYEKLKVGNLIVRNPFFAMTLEKIALHLIDDVIVMVEESQMRLMRMGVPIEKISIVSNTPVTLGERAKQSGECAEASKERKVSENIKLVYVGLLNPSRGLEVAIRGVSEYSRTGGSVSFTVVGSGKCALQLAQLVQKLKLQCVVEFTGWLPNAEAIAWISSCDIGIVPHYKCSHWDTTIPNKLFDYMWAGKPVIVSRAIPTARIVQECECGIVYDDRDPCDLARALLALQSAEVRHAMGVKGRKAIKERYNWEYDEVVLRRVIEPDTRVQ